MMLVLLRLSPCSSMLLLQLPTPVVECCPEGTQLVVFQPTTFGKYFLTRRIAIGGMAEIFAAKLYGADGFEKDLVIKQILPQYSRDPEFIQSFVAEAKIAVSLSHANIVAIYELGRVDGTYFIAMELVDGMDVYGLIQASKRHNMPIGVGEALLIVEQVASGLDYAHRRNSATGDALGLVHRDLNPRNVLVSREGDAKILDFGIAKTEAAEQSMPMTRAGMVKGTSGYMSPEQAMGRDVDARTDIYQAGLLLYELLTGEALFWRPDDLQTRELMRAHQITPVSEVVPGLPVDIDPIVLKTLAWRPEERTQSAQELMLKVAQLRMEHFPDASHGTLGRFVRTIQEKEDELIGRQHEEFATPVDIEQIMTRAVEAEGSSETFARVASVQSNRSMMPGSQSLHSSMAPMMAGEAPKKGKGMLVGLVVLLLALGGGGFFAFTQFSKPEPKPATQVAPKPTPPPAPKPAAEPPKPAETPKVAEDAPKKEPEKKPEEATETAEAKPAPAPTPRPRRRRAPAPAPEPVGFAKVDFGTRSCSSRVSVDGSVVARTTPSFGHQIPAGTHLIVISGVRCPPKNYPGSLRRSIPVIRQRVTFKANVHTRIIADFDANKLIQH